MHLTTVHVVLGLTVSQCEPLPTPPSGHAKVELEGLQYASWSVCHTHQDSVTHSVPHTTSFLQGERMLSDVLMQEHAQWGLPCQLMQGDEAQLWRTLKIMPWSPWMLRRKG